MGPLERCEGEIVENQDCTKGENPSVFRSVSYATQRVLCDYSWAHLRWTDHWQRPFGRLLWCCWIKPEACFGDAGLLLSRQPPACLFFGSCKSLLSKHWGSPLVNEVNVVFHCTICLAERLLQTFSYATVLGTSKIFSKRKFSIIESSTARKHNAGKVLCSDHLLNRLFPLGRTLALHYKTQLI